MPLLIRITATQLQCIKTLYIRYCVSLNCMYNSENQDAYLSDVYFFGLISFIHWSDGDQQLN